MQTLINIVANFLYGLVLKWCFRTEFSSKRMRRNLDLLVGISKEKLQKKYGVTIDSLDLNGVAAENISSLPVLKESKVAWRSIKNFVSSNVQC